MNNGKINMDITPKKDLVFKRLFGSKGNEEILKDFLESILDVKIDSLVLDLNTELLPEFYEGKQSRVDVRTKLSDGTEVNIEIQADAKKYSDDRCILSDSHTTYRFAVCCVGASAKYSANHRTNTVA